NATDNCGIDASSFTLLSEVSDNNSCPEVVTRTYRIADNCGNTADYVQTITIDDDTAPTFDAIPGDLSAVCDLSEQPAYADYAEFTAAGGNATDNCGIDASSFTLLSEVSDNNSCPEVVTRTYQIADNCGNTVDYVQTITIDDDTAPTFDAVPGDLSAVCDLSEQPAYADYAEFTAAGGNATDNCGIDASSFTLLSEVSDNNSCPEVVTRTYRIADNCGNTVDYVQVITIEDVIQPVISGCPSDITVPVDAGSCDAAVLWTEPTATDNCSLADFSGSHTPGSIFPVGVTTVTYTATDDCGNTSICSFDITVTDDEAPVMTVCAADSTVSSDADCEAEVPDLTGEVTATDNCSGSITITQSPVAGTIITSGITNVVLTVSDGSGNSVTCNADVIVIDDTDPVLITVDTTVYIGPGNIAVIDSSFVWDDVSSDDNCGITAVTLDNDTFDCSMLGSNTVNVTAYDDAGNSATGTAVVTVSDTNTVVADAGPDADMCITDGTYTPAAANVVNGTVLWGTTGDGSFDDPTLVNPAYTLGAGDTDSVKLYMDVTPVTGCTPASDTMKLYIYDAPQAEAGDNIDICNTATDVAITTADYENGTLLWASSGDGTFDDNTVINPVYTLGASDADSVTLTLTVSGYGSCGTAIDSMKIYIFDAPAADAGADDTVCASGISYSITDASSSGGTVAWTSDGDGSFDDQGIDNPVYTFGSGDISAGTVTLTMTVTGIGTCGDDIDDKIIVINELPGIIVDEHSDISCYGLNDGILRISGNAGTAPYQYSIDGGAFQASGEFTGLAAGDHNISVIDANACGKDTTITITEPDEFTFVLDTVIHNSCYGSDDAAISITITGGTQPYSISWTGPGGFSSTEEDLSNLSAGQYSLNLTDANNCNVFTLDTTITQPPEIVITPVSTSDYNSYGVSCYGATDGFIEVDVSGGTGNLTLSWEGPGGFASADEDITDLQGGNYELTVTDDTGCTETYDVTLSEPAELTIDYNVTDASCPGVEDGAIDLTITGGVTPYTILWSDGETVADRNAITEGDYSVDVTDANSCTTQALIPVGVIGLNCVEVPEIITPGVVDGKNDVLKIMHISLYPDAEIKIFNRWGKMIYSAKNLEENQWDGTFKGKALPVDSYHYILDLGDGSTPKTGTITIIR
ncbi:MAG: gliding motility-associated C-terminal domain-containing protein, partial [Bacteroidales bacterium]|nr:gliding motility-associated C-terminal domain-containing protein [Bacteroidales bacterium]